MAEMKAFCLACTLPYCIPERCPMRSGSIPNGPRVSYVHTGQPEGRYFAHGEEHTIKEWSAILGVKPITLYQRLRRGIHPNDALVREYHRRNERKKPMNWMQMAYELHASAKDKGFWSVENATECALANMHCELSEAIQADRMSMPMVEIERDGAKPEGVAVELADFVMRVMDFAANMGVRIRAPRAHGTMSRIPLPRLVLRMHQSVTEIVVCTIVPGKYSPTRIADVCNAMISAVNAWLEVNGVSLESVIMLKHEYNQTRPALHGKRY